MRTAEELHALVERALADLELSPDLGGLEPVLRYALGSGGKRVRPVLCLATTEAVGGDAEDALPAALAVELVHTFSLVHDDLPALDDDDERRGRPSAHVAFGEGVALLAGDALLTEAFRLALTYADTAIAAELADATVGMIGGQHRDITGDDADLTAVDLLKTGRLFAASVVIGLRVTGARDDEDAWRAFGSELGLLFQIVDDLLDDDGLVPRLGRDGAAELASSTAAGVRDRLSGLRADTAVLVGIVDDLASRTA